MTPSPATIRRHAVPLAILAAFAVAALVFGLPWLSYRFTHSISKDAFVESHLVNVSPQVAGNIVEIYAQEQERVKKGQLLGLIDPSIYKREVELASAKLEVAQAALAKSQSDLELLEQQVPKQVAAAEAKLAAARDNEKKADAAVTMVTQDVDDAVTAANRSVDATQAAVVLADEDLVRYSALYTDGSVSQRRLQEATKTHDVAQAERKIADARLGQARANKHRIDIAQQELAAATSAVADAQAALDLAKLGDSQIAVLEKQVAENNKTVTQAQRAVELAQTNLDYTKITAPFDCVIAKKWRHLGDYSHTGDPIFSIYNPDFVYVTVHLEETRLEGVNPGNWATLKLEAYEKSFRGRVVWIGSATGANFSLIPRDLSSGEFTYVVQRVPTRIAVERDDRWPLLKPGLSVTVDIEHGPGDKQWADAEWERERKEADVETAPAAPASGAQP
jgi:membrane fusion protein (multidrug efflux system)